MAKHITQQNPDSADDATDAKIERNKHIILVLVTVFTTVAFVGYCIYIVLAHAVSADDIKWATSILSGILGGLFGYFINTSRRGDKA